jgi:hypothetical protein
VLQRSPAPTLHQHPAERGGAAAAGMLEITIQRLEEIVEQETAALKSRQAVYLKDYNDRKSQALLDMTRALRQIQAGSKPPPNVTDRLGNLRAKLEVNRRVLQMHLEAVREVSTTLADAIREADSDGTYNPSQRSAGKAS